MKMSIAATLYANYCPRLIKNLYRRRKVNKLISFFENKELNEEQKTALENIRADGIRMFPYDFTEKYKYHVDVSLDPSGNKYVMHKDRRLYFPNDLTSNQIQVKYLSLLAEQDDESPHHYFTENFKVEKNDVFFDIGSAEGMLTLECLSQCKKAFVFECEERWISALGLTFSDFGEKVSIINRYVSDEDVLGHTQIDEYMRESYDSVVFKMDVEGNELQVLRGMESVFSSTRAIKIAVCTYHNNNDFEEISEFLVNRGFEIETSAGYMIFDPVNPPYLRRGVIRASRTS
jgi:hypothetical protein